MSRIVTFTGIDDNTDLVALKELTKKNKYIEIGVLVSLNNTNTGIVNRFPSFKTIDRAIELGISLSCHVCGSLARNYIKTGDFTPIREFLGEERVKAFNRFQFNINGFDNYKVFRIVDDIHIILQVNGDKSWRYYQDMLRANSDQVERVSMLSDKSGGTGKLDTFDFVADYDEYIGYAGGINKDNVMYILGYIDGRNEKKLSYWIDMESSIRKDDWFSIDLVKEICNEINSFKGLV